MTARRCRRQGGLSLIEVMIGMAIGMISLLVISQMATQFDQQRRATTGGADAQTTGIMAINIIESDLKQAGYGLSSLQTMNCTMVNAGRPFNGAKFMPIGLIASGIAAGQPGNLLGIPPGDTGTDMVFVMYGHSTNIIEGSPITLVTPTKTEYGMNPNGINIGDYVMAAQEGRACTIGQVTGPNPIASPVQTDQSYGTTVYDANTAQIYALGARGMTMNIYAVRNGNLTVCDYWNNDCDDATKTGDASVWVPIAANVVGMRVQYGWDTSATQDMATDVFCRSHVTAGNTCPAGNADDGATAPSAACDWTRVAAMRIGIITRSPEPVEDARATPTDATLKYWPDSTTAPTTTGPTLSLTATERKYRYKVFQTTIPVRNTIWMGAQGGC